MIFCVETSYSKDSIRNDKTVENSDEEEGRIVETSQGQSIELQDDVADGGVGSDDSNVTEDSYELLTEDVVKNELSEVLSAPEYATKTKLAVGESHTLLLKSDGTVWSWGRNNYGQCGTGAASQTNQPITQIAGLENIIDISVGLNHNLALDQNGMVWAWGYNNYGQLGNNTTANSAMAV